VAFGGASLFSLRLTGLVWLLMYFCFIPACLVFDSTPARRRAFISYASLLCSMIAMLAGRSLVNIMLAHLLPRSLDLLPPGYIGSWSKQKVFTCDSST
jgi:hypothetical protein